MEYSSHRLCCTATKCNLAKLVSVQTCPALDVSPLFLLKCHFGGHDGKSACPFTESRRRLSDPWMHRLCHPSTPKLHNTALLARQKQRSYKGLDRSRTHVHAPLLQDERLAQDHSVRSVRLDPVHHPRQGCVAPVVRPPAVFSILERLAFTRQYRALSQICVCHDFFVWIFASRGEQHALRKKNLAAEGAHMGPSQRGSLSSPMHEVRTEIDREGTHRCIEAKSMPSAI